MSTAPTDAPRGSKAVIVQAGGNAFRDAGRLIAERGYPIISSDADIGVISTDFLSLDSSPVMVRINATVSDGAVRLTGHYKSGPSAGAYDIEMAGMSGSPLRQAWAELEAVATLMGKELSYE